MAFVKSFSVDGHQGKLHRTNVDAKVRIFAASDNSPIVQIDTYGSNERAFTNKLSQTIQLDRKSADELFHILKNTYGF